MPLVRSRLKGGISENEKHSTAFNIPVPQQTIQSKENLRGVLQYQTSFQHRGMGASRSPQITTVHSSRRSPRRELVMARSNKDRRQEGNSNTTQKVREPFTRRYLHYKRHGEIDPGDYCPDCGDPTGFQNGFLVCQGCGWIDSGSDAIEIDFNFNAA